RLSPSLAAYILHEVCAGLAAALESRARDGSPLRWTHGQLCPRAVHLSVNGEVKVSGFGIGRLKPYGHRHTVDETLLYLAPEQVRGVSSDARTDVFALGAVLHAMLVGPLLDVRDVLFEFLKERVAGTGPLVKSGLLSQP